MVIVLIITIFVLWFLIFTPYPFVWFLRSKKEEPQDKSPQNIEEIKAELRIERGLEYPSKYPQATYDIYSKNECCENLVLWVHGGAFISGTSEGMKNFGPMLASHDYLVVAMNYAYAPRFSFPVQIKQMDELLCFLKGQFPHIKNVILGGDSAGANIAASYASFYKNEGHPMKLDLKNTLNIKGLLLFCGPYDFTEDSKKDAFKEFKMFMKYIGWSYLGHRNWEDRKEKGYASPLLNIHENYPPVYLCDGKKFSFMWQGKKFERALKQNNIHMKSRFYEDMPHEFQFEYQKYEKEAMQVYQDSIEFLEEVLNEEKQ